ncbi:MAG: TolC family protein [Bacteroidales bacterium]|nr:TolC family protein [Bacteroidales bacterium]HOO66269.1 TolC family protein [Bacteroidales bacterium]HPJ04752.1 TolC family protein [Bacteroidales bacterium]HPQ63470.1 TolC family protein [Bacteroidales bacterium]HRW28035.1 TolC family protein [Bacteroidales bacterium]
MILFLLLPLVAGAQKTMNLDEAIMVALENNYSLKISRNDESIAQNNVSLAPFLPTITGTGRQSQTNNNTESSTAESDRTRNNLYTAGVTLNWRLFDGLGMFTDYSRQQEMLAMSSQRVKINVENLIMRVCSEYYNIIVQQNRMQSALTSLTLSRSRYENAEEKYFLGVISGLDLQQARIDLNADSSAVLSQQETVISAYIRMTNLLNAGHDIDFNINDTIILAPEIDIDSLRERTLQYNNQLILARQGEKLSDYDLQSVRADRYPTLNFSTGYNFSRNEYPWQADSYNQTNGLNWGFNMSWNIFSGLETSRRIANAKIEAESSRLSYLDIENEILGELDLLYNTYRNNIIVASFETQSAEVARASLEIAMERYRLGSLSGLEFREYQNNYLNAINRRLTALYQAKISEIGLRLLAGELTE